jgi:hypothetical protein
MYENKGTGKMLSMISQNPKAGIQISGIELQLLAPESCSQKMKVHPAMCMKTNERKNLSRPTLGNMPGASASELCGGRWGSPPNFRFLDSLLDGISREVYENKGTGKIPSMLPQNPVARIQASSIEYELLNPGS